MNNFSPQVFAFAKIDDPDVRNTVYQEIKRGKSRFGMWDQEVSLREQYHGRNGFLLRIQAGDWIVHVNMPNHGHCVAVQTLGEYDFDEGFKIDSKHDFRNYIPVNVETMIEFERLDPNILPSVNLAPMRRGQRVLQVEDFLQSLANLRQNKFSTPQEKTRGVIHLQEKMQEKILPQITDMIQKMNRSKEFECFLHRIFCSMPNVESVQNGFGWKSDYGADLIVSFQNPLIEVSLISKLVVQAKSYEGNHFDTNSIDQLIKAIQKFSADGGLLITTAQKTEHLEDYARKMAEEHGKIIDIIAGNDVARFVIRHAPEVLFGIENKKTQL